MSTRPLVSALVVLFGAAPAHAAPVLDDHPCMGPWVGQAPNPDQTMFGITLTMTASPDGGRCGTVEYTNPVCGGTLERCTTVDGDIHTQELYSHGQSNCAPAGRVIIRCEGDTMRYRWSGQYTATTVLRRPPGWQPAPRPPPAPRIVPPVVQPIVPPPPSPLPPPRAEPERESPLGCHAGARSAAPAWALVAITSMIAVTRRRGR